MKLDDIEAAYVLYEVRCCTKEWKSSCHWSIHYSTAWPTLASYSEAPHKKRTYCVLLVGQSALSISHWVIKNCRTFSVLARYRPSKRRSVGPSCTLSVDGSHIFVTFGQHMVVPQLFEFLCVCVMGALLSPTYTKNYDQKPKTSILNLLLILSIQRGTKLLLLALPVPPSSNV